MPLAIRTLLFNSSLSPKYFSLRGDNNEIMKVIKKVNCYKCSENSTYHVKLIILNRWDQGTISCYMQIKDAFFKKI